MILEDFNSNKDSVIQRIGELVDIESPTCDEPSLSKAADWLVSQAQTIPAITTIERIRREGYGEHLIFRAFEGAGSPVLLIGHYDTVHPLGTKEKNPTRHEGGRLFGCGVFDMKANLVLILEALRAVAENGASSRQINIFISCDEEVGSPTGRKIVEREASLAEHVLIFEPSLDGKAKTGRKGTASFIIKTYGIPAHAGLEPEKGASAIAELAKQILEIEKMNRPEKGTSVNATIVKGGTASNVIASEAECELDIRFTDLDEARRVEMGLKGLQAADSRVRIEVLGEINRPPLERTESVIALLEKAKGIAKGLGYELGEAQVGGASDGNFVAALGVPVIDGLGIKGNGAHTLGEYIETAEIPFRTALIANLLVGDRV